MKPELNPQGLRQEINQSDVPEQARNSFLREAVISRSCIAPRDKATDLPRLEIISDGSMSLINKDSSQVKLNSDKKVIQIIDAKGHSTSFIYGKNGEIKEFSDKEGSFHSTDGLSWYKKGNGPPKSPDKFGAVTIAEDYSIVISSSGGRSCAIKHLDGTTTLNDREGAKTKFDHKGNLIQIIDSDDKQTIFHYDASGKSDGKTIINPDRSQMKLNQSGQIIELEDTKGRKTSLKYGTNGAPNEISDPRGSYNTKDGNTWLPTEKRFKDPPFVRGEIKIKENGTLVELNKDNGSIVTRSLTGAKKIYESPNALDQVKDTVQKIFSDIDTDKNGYLSGSELGKAMENRRFTGREAQIIAALHKNRQKIADLSNDEIGKETSICNTDLEQLDFLQRNKQSLTDAQDWIKKDDHFKKIDKDGNGFLSKQEIVDNMNWRDNANMKALTFLFDNYEWLENQNDDETGAENDGITKEDLAAVDRNHSILANVQKYMSRTSETQNPDLPDTLYSSVNAKDSIKPDAIQQGAIGNCYFEAALASMAASKPANIRQLIQTNKDGSYTVRFPGDPAHPITVQAPTEAEMGLFNSKSSYGIWANVMEKAYGKYRLEISKGLDTRGNPVFTPTEGADGGGHESEVFQLLTGKKSTIDYLENIGENNIRRHLTAAFQEKRAVTCSCHRHPSLNQNDKFTPLGYIKHHALSITAFDPAGPDGGTITIRNPWGNKVNGPGGTMQISFRQLMDNFNSFHYEGS